MPAVSHSVNIRLLVDLLPGPLPPNVEQCEIPPMLDTRPLLLPRSSRVPGMPNRRGFNADTGGGQPLQQRQGVDQSHRILNEWTLPLVIIHQPLIVHDTLRYLLPISRGRPATETEAHELVQ